MTARTARRVLSTRRRSPRRALTLLVLGPLLCGVLLAGAITAAWLVLGEPVPAQGAVWFQVTKLGSARNEGAPQQPFFALVLGTGARSDDPSQSPDDPGLADAVHVIGVNPALEVGHHHRHPARHRGPGRRQDQLVHREQPRRQRAPRRGRRGVGDRRRPRSRG